MIETRFGMSILGILPISLGRWRTQTSPLHTAIAEHFGLSTSACRKDRGSNSEKFISVRLARRAVRQSIIKLNESRNIKGGKKQTAGVEFQFQSTGEEEGTHILPATVRDF
jgi:hypothetical protein